MTELPKGFVLYRIPVCEDSPLLEKGITHLESLEYSELADENDVRTMRVTKPAGHWTVGGLAEALLVMQNTIASLPPYEEENDPEL